MATPVVILDTVEVVMEANRGGRERRNVIHYGYNGFVPSVGQLEALCNEVANNVINSQQAITCDPTLWNRVTATDLRSGGLGATASVSIYRVGTFVGACAPGNVALCLTKRSGIRGPSHRGRFYMFDLPEGGLDDDTVTLGMLPYLTNLSGELQYTRVGGIFYPAIASRVIGLCYPIQSITFDLITDSQRRRLTGRGR